MFPLVDYILSKFSSDLGVDLGTVNTLISVKDKGIVVREPSIVAQHKKSKKLIAIGTDAKNMLGRTPAHIAVVSPMKEGVISDYDATLAMLSHFVKRIHSVPGGIVKIPRPKIIIGIPTNVTEVEKRALLNVCRASGAREAYLVEEPIAAAIGAGLPIGGAVGNMIVDIGGGTCEIAVISLNGIVVGRSLKIGGNVMDGDIINYFRTRWGLTIGEKTAEDVKIALASAYPMRAEREMVVRGRDLEKGLPKAVKVSSVDVREALSATISTIVAAVRDTLHDAPPELAADIAVRGIVLCGGGSLIWGLAKLVSQEVKMPTTVADDPLSCVARGCSILLSDDALLARVKVNINR